MGVGAGPRATGSAAMPGARSVWNRRIANEMLERERTIPAEEPFRVGNKAENIGAARKTIARCRRCGFLLAGCSMKSSWFGLKIAAAGALSRHQYREKSGARIATGFTGAPPGCPVLGDWNARNELLVGASHGSARFRIGPGASVHGDSPR